MKVKTYLGHKVPDGATCFVKACEAYKNHFGKEVDGIEYVFVIDHELPEWSEISNIIPLSARGAIELPEETKPDWSNAPTDTAVWIQDNKAEAGSDFSGWYKEINDDGQYYECGSGDYVHSRNSDMFTVYSRPKVEPEVWVDGLPPVGTSCLTLHYGELVECLYVGKGLGEEFIYQVSSGCHRGEIDRLIGSPKFRPLKTQAEKDREEFHLKAFEIHKHDMSCNEFATALYDAGFTAPKAEV